MTRHELRFTLERMTPNELEKFRSKFGGSPEPDEIVDCYVDHLIKSSDGLLEQ